MIDSAVSNLFNPNKLEMLKRQINAKLTRVHPNQQIVTIDILSIENCMPMTLERKETIVAIVAIPKVRSHTYTKELMGTE